jgi:hypothetical protein
MTVVVCVGGTGNHWFKNSELKVLETWKKSEEEVTGSRLVLMPMTRWLRIAQEDRAMTAMEAKDAWDEKLHEKPVRPMHRKKVNGVQWLAMPTDEFVDSLTRETHSQEVQCQGKKKNKPDMEHVQSQISEIGIEPKLPQMLDSTCTPKKRTGKSEPQSSEKQAAGSSSGVEKNQAETEDAKKRLARRASKGSGLDVQEFGFVRAGRSCE